LISVKPSLVVSATLLALTISAAPAPTSTTVGLASWYGEEHRGKPMANGDPFDPDKLTAASWFYPLGTRVRVSVDDSSSPARSVLVTITDRGPSRRLVRAGRIIDLSRAAFARLAPPESGLVSVIVEPATIDSEDGTRPSSLADDNSKPQGPTAASADVTQSTLPGRQ
jgi:rare lipoprotein A